MSWFAFPNYHTPKEDEKVKQQQQQQEKDANLARALQQQYDREDPHTAAPPISLRDKKASAVETLAMTTTASSSCEQDLQQQQLNEDEALARRLVAEEEARAQASALAAAAASSGDGYTFAPEEGPIGADDRNNNDDDKGHRRADFSRTRSVKKSFYKYSSYLFPIHQETGRCTKPRRRHYISMAILVAMGLGCAFGLIYHFVILGGDADELVNVFTGPENNGNFVDPFTGDGDPKKWQTASSDDHDTGLQMTVLNALQDKWYPFFYTAISDWDDGYPDALELETQVVDYDYNCTPVANQVKVCNGNYGATGWRGLVDYRLSQAGFILSVRARMNENYTGNAEQDADEMQYVMCHELGHSWGLTHSDENFENPDVGDCLEYTKNPANSRKPGDFQYEILYDLYGLRPGAAPYTPPQKNTTGTSDRRALKGRASNDGLTVSAKTRDQLLLQQNRIPHLDSHLDPVYNHLSGELLQPHQWRVLQRNPYSERHEIDLPNGDVFQVYKLLA